jgi:hypothetical protein
MDYDNKQSDNKKKESVMISSQTRGLESKSNLNENKQSMKI